MSASTSDTDVITETQKKLYVRLVTIAEEKHFTASMCKMHFSKQPMKLSRASKQYIYDDEGFEYMDCSGNLAHVGHCHPHVTYSGQKQMSILSVAQGFVTEIQTTYAKRLLKSFNNPVYDTILFVNSGSEANDLAIRLAKAHTQRKDMLVTMPALHGQLHSLCSYNYTHTESGLHKHSKRVHHIELCDKFRGKYSECDDPVDKSISDIKSIINDLCKTDRLPAAFITEPAHSADGYCTPPKTWLPSLSRLLKEHGALLIMDEVVTGLGRFGTHLWGHEHFNVTPDIVTCGRCMGNGQPLACVITSREIASSLGVTYANSFGGNPVSCSMGSAVLDVIENEKLLASCTAVSNYLHAELNKICEKYEQFGEVRGMGLCISLYIVDNKENRKPNRSFAEKLTYRLRDNYKIITACEGPDKNCIYVNPPLCFSIENANTLVTAIDAAFADVISGRTNPVRDVFDLQKDFNLDQELSIELLSTGSKRKLQRNPKDPEKKAKYADLD